MRANRLIAVLTLLLTLCTCRGAFAVSVLLITDNNGTLTAAESNLKSLMQMVGFTVNTLWDGSTQATYASAYANNDVVYIPSDVSATDIGTKLRACPIGVVNELVGFMDDLGLCSVAGTTTTAASITIVTNAHYITSPFATGPFSLGSSTYAISQAGGVTASGAVVLASVGSANSILAVDTGATLANTISGNNTATGRRVQMPIQCGVVNAGTLSASAQALLPRLAIWAALREGKLEAQWKLDETSGASAADSSGNGKTGAVTGASAWVSAVLNNGFAFDGATKIQAAGLMGNPRNVSVAAWANLTTADTSGSEIISMGDHFALRLDEAGAAKAVFYNGSSYVTASYTAKYVGTGWHHFAAVFDDGHNSLKLYIDGLQAVSTTTTASISWSGLGSDTVIGRNGNNGASSDFTGALDEVRVYSYALSASEVAQLYGLVGRWKLTETSGTTASDATVFNRSGALTGSAGWSTDCGGMGAFNFDGSSHYFTVTNAPDFQPTTMLSIAAWVQGDSWGAGSSTNTIIRKGDTTPNKYALQIADGRVELLLDGTDGSGIRGNTVLAAGQWYHIAATWDGTTAKIYVNGVLDNSPGAAKASPIASDSRPLYIGGRPGGCFFDGMIRDVRLYNRPLTSAELVQLAGLVGWWKFAEGSSTEAADSSGLGNNATLSGGASWTSDCAGNNNALLTNGAGGIAQSTAAFAPPDVGTVAFWLRSTGAPADVARIIGVGADWEIRQQVDGTVVTDLCGDGATTICTLTPLTEVGRWYHLAFTFDSSNDTYAIYVDGKLERSGTNPVSMVQQPSDLISFGTRTGSTQFWNGALRDVRIYNRKLCPTEIASLYGLGGYWKFDETSGSVASDSSGMGRDGAVTGSPTWVPGVLNNALQVGSSSYVQASTLCGSPRNVTLAAWANLTGIGPNGAELVSLGDYIAIRLDEAGNTKVFFYNGSNWTFVTVAQTYRNKGWHHFAAVFNDDANKATLYVDGISVASASTSASIIYSGQGDSVVVGRHGNNKSGWTFTGKIDDVRIYTRALCPLEIQALKNSGNPFGGVKVTKWIEIQ